MSSRDLQTTFCAFGHAAHLHDAIAQPRRRLEVEVLGGLGHLVLQAREQRLLLAFEKEHDLVDRAIVLFFRLIADAGRQAALDVVLQARTLAPSVDRLAARAQRKDEPHQIDQLAQAVRVGVGSEVARAVVAHHAREDDARKRLVGHLQVRIALVVAQPHVERRLMALDQVGFEDERLDLVGDDDRAHVDDALRPSPPCEMWCDRALLKIRTHAVAQRDGLTDVENLVAGPDHQVDAGRVGDLRERRLTALTAPARSESARAGRAPQPQDDDPGDHGDDRQPEQRRTRRDAAAAAPRRVRAERVARAESRPLQKISEPSNVQR